VEGSKLKNLNEECVGLVKDIKKTRREECEDSQ